MRAGCGRISRVDEAGACFGMIRGAHPGALRHRIPGYPATDGYGIIESVRGGNASFQQCPASAIRPSNTTEEEIMVALNINGKVHEVDVDPDTPLLWAIRENVGMTGTKYGCGVAQCGACTVHVDGVAMRSCVFPVSAAVGKQIVTIEGIAQSGKLHPVQKAWIDLDVPQCGYCQSGMIMAVTALLKEKPKPSDADIDAAITNICRCGTFQQVRAAIHAAVSA
jgi:isoquinoline 1-oxidoreductase subunit alpha